MKVLLVAINAKYIHSNLAVFSLCRYAKERCKTRDIEIDIAEYTINNRIEEIVPDIYKMKADVIAFSTYIWNVEYVTKIATAIRKVMPQVTIWGGGPEISYRAAEFISQVPAFDMIMCGEGEKLFSDSIIRLYDGEEVKGILTCDEPLSMDELPYVYDRLPDFDNKIIYYETSRGCPFSCSYCLSSVDKKTRFKSFDIVKEELAHLIENKVKLVKFVDRTFNASHKHAMNIWQYIKDNDNGVTTFHCELSADLINDEEIEFLASLRKGLLQFEIGIQSFNEKTLKEIKRVTDNARLCEVVNRLHEAGNIHIHLDLIAGLPYEDIDSFADSFNKVYALKPDEFQLGFLKVLSGSHMAKMQNEYGIVKNESAPYEVMSTKWLSYDDILLLKNVEEVLEIYYNSRQFDKSVSYIVNYFETSFKMYEKLGKVYDEQFDVGMNHSRIKRYEFLYDFAKDIVEDNEFLKELLIYDIYARENSKTRPSFAKTDNDYTAKVCREKNISKKLYHAEFFEYDIKEFEQSGRIKKCGKVYLFDYSERNPLTYNVTPCEVVYQRGCLNK